MKLEKLDHKHALTSWLKVILFACLMLAPIMSVVVRSLYVVCNKNAKDSYYGETSNQIDYNLLDNITSFEIGNTYLLNPNTFNIKDTNTPQGAYARKIGLQNFTILDSNINNLPNDINSIGFYISADSQLSLQFSNGVNDVTVIFTNSNNRLLCTFEYLNNNLNYNFAYNDIFYSLTYNQNAYLDNVFDYSISQIEESQFYNWTQNTAIYNGVEAMTTGLGITGATVPILITYWFLLTIIYIVIDIVINLFTYLTHFLNKKTN